MSLTENTYLLQILVNILVLVYKSNKMLFQNGCHFIDQNVGNRTKINETEQVLKGSLIVLDVENKALFIGKLSLPANVIQFS